MTRIIKIILPLALAAATSAAPGSACADPAEIAVPAAPVQPKTMLARMAQQQMQHGLDSRPLPSAPVKEPAKTETGGSLSPSGAPSSKTGESVILHRGSKSYHRPGCQWYDMNPQVITLEEAERIGMPACGLCGTRSSSEGRDLKQQDAQSQPSFSPASPDTSKKSAAPQGAVIYHKGSHSYHRPGCQWYDVNTETITLEEAERIGMPACGLCAHL